ncbi:hypothetical protein RISK_003321 [Rhodopirellula islandica]|uniref:Uncharacterized protein n=1 Tax=Rhodopirellula islandica TaxID=595434 RepID=A0A0J1EGN1_RHOIS|nr:hypothetical protein RISK_003321 [Rhodopirellula islandica]
MSPGRLESPGVIVDSQRQLNGFFATPACLASGQRVGVRLARTSQSP